MKQVTLQTYRERLLRVAVYIQDHLDEELSIAELSKISHFSPFHFHRIFHAMVGEAVHKHVRRLRLERAAIMLRQTNRLVVQLSLDAGYETHESFTRAFKSMFGMSPTEFRNDKTNSIERWGRYRFDDVKETVDLNLQIEIKRIPPKRIAFVRHVGPYDQVGVAFDTLLTWAAPLGLLGGGIQILGVCYDHPEITQAENIRYDAALTIDDDIQPEGEIGVRVLPGSDYAVACHEGPYNTLSHTYNIIYGRWLPSSGRVPGDTPPIEVYLNSPDGTDPEDLLTDLYIPLKNRL